MRVVRGVEGEGGESGEGVVVLVVVRFYIVGLQVQRTWGVGCGIVGCGVWGVGCGVCGVGVGPIWL